MSGIKWETIKYFKPSEFGNEEAQGHLDYNLVWLLDKFREASDLKINVHCAWQSSGHAPNSLHYEGKAVDIHMITVNNTPVDLFTQYELALKFGAWRGIGLYPYWNNPGLHLDIRKETIAKTWFQDFNKSYKPVTKAIIMKLATE